MPFQSLLILILTTYLSTLTLTLAATLSNTTHNGLGSTPIQRHCITSTQAQNILTAAASTASTLNAAENIAILDPSGLLVAFLRMDNAFPGGVDLAIKKAKTVVMFNGLTSVELYPAAAYRNGTLFGLEQTNGGLVLFPGGLPLYKDGFLLGAIGASGGTIDQDVLVAQAGVEWLSDSRDA